MPTTPPRQLVLASCVPAPPEDEVLDWTPEEEDDEGPALDSTILKQPKGVPCRSSSSGLCSPGVAMEELPPVLELHNFEPSSEERHKYERVDVTMDSGAAVPVADPKQFPGCVMTDSPGSRAGQEFVCLNGSRIPTEGQFTAPMRSEVRRR